MNPGSVGQPATAMPGRLTRLRIRSGRPSHCIESRTRLKTAQKKILEAGLPPALAYRLAMGR